MSTTSGPFTFSSRIASPSPSASQSGGGGNGAPTTFYKNLFYILIGLLCAFGLVSFLSLLRARRRRAAILREAERLGVLVPGIPGYIPLRDRDEAAWTKPDGTISPDWWEVKQDKNDGGGAKGKDGEANVDQPPVGGFDFSPLAIIPPVEERRHEPPPVSNLPYFPNHLAYRPESLFPPPSRFVADSLSSLDGLAGEHVEVLTIIQMPTPPWPTGREVSEEEEVIKEWSGIELGMVKMDVRSAER